MVFLVCPIETPSLYHHKTVCLQKDKRKRGMIFSNDGMDMLKHLEGFKDKPYIDSGGNASIGYGHKIKKGELFTSITEAQAELLLRQDIEPLETFLNDRLDTLVTQNQFDAVLIFIYNIGTGAFLESHVFQYLKNKQYKKATHPWSEWVNVTETVKPKTGRKLVKKRIPVRGLIKRRAAEIELFNT